MLSHLHIQNLAVVDEVELELDPGLTVLTGETGAGKSILVDALALALGERADSRAVRSGKQRCEVTAMFDIGTRPGIGRWLTEHELDADAECLLRRIVTAEGRSRGYINGHSVSMQMLRELGAQLVDICSQHAHQSLLDRGVQRELLDEFGKHADQVNAMAAAFSDWRVARERLDALLSRHLQGRQREELLRFQVGELDALKLEPGEYEALEAAHRALANAERIAATGTAALHAIYEADDANAHTQVGRTRAEIEGLADFDQDYAPIAKLLAEAEILIGEAANGLRGCLDRIEHAPQRLAEVEQRLESIRLIARKHQVTAEELVETAASLRQQLDDFTHSDERVAELEEQTAVLDDRMQRAAEELTAARQRSAVAMAERITHGMRELGLSKGRFEIVLHPLEDSRIGANGSEQIEFLVTANPGQAPGPLARIASGGELSRLSLAVQIVALGKGAVPALIFDEVDAGVGGGVAELVGLHLSELSRTRQVLCVTHLPQVASQADHHMRVTKTSEENSTRIAVAALDAADRLEEIARMLGGRKITARTRAHAEEMLAAAARGAG